MKISDYVESQIKGLWGTDFDENGIPVIKTNNLTYEGNIDYSDICKRNITREHAKEWYLKPGDLLIEKSGGTKTHSVGYVSYFEGDENKFVCNNFILALRLKNTINSKFLFYQIQFKYESNQFSDCFNKTTGIQNLKVKDYLAKEIKIYSPEEQEKIVKELDTVRLIINKNKQILEKYDILIKSRFIEMFGDISTGNYKFETRKLGSVSEVGSSHRVFTTEFVEQGVPFYRGTEIGMLANGQQPEEPFYISEEHYNRLTEHDSKPKIGDLLMPSICNKGQVWMVDTEFPFYYKDGRVLSISPNQKIYNSKYLQYFMREKTIVEYPKLGSGSTFAEFKIFLLKDIDVLTPPISLQNDFAAFVQQIDKSKFEMAIYEKVWYNYGKWYFIMANFDYLLQYKEFSAFSGLANEAEKQYNKSTMFCGISARKCVEQAVNWMYSVDDDLYMPYDDSIQVLVHDKNFVNIVPGNIQKDLQIVIKVGNQAVHSNTEIDKAHALLSLKALFNFLNWIVFTYSSTYESRTFDENLIPANKATIIVKKNQEEIDKYRNELDEKEQSIADLKKQLADLQKALTSNKSKPKDDSKINYETIDEKTTRKLFIDEDLKKLGWQFDGVMVQEEYPVHDMGDKHSDGFVDYVLFGKDHKPLAVVEAKKTSKDPNIGKQQAKDYADCLEHEYGQRPFIFYTNGFDCNFWDDTQAAPRKVSMVFSQGDLQKLIDRRNLKEDLNEIQINRDITGRDYQLAAIKAVVKSANEGFRKFLLVMATGTGKTRTVISLTDVFARANYATNILFLTDRIQLVKQAYSNYKEHLKSMSLCNMLDYKSRQNDKNARIVFSTYPTILNAIDTDKTEDGERLFTPAHFDLIIIDEAHRSIFKKYRAIFDYFDAYLVGLTATPREEVERSTFDFFELEHGNPTYNYTYEEAIKAGYLVDYYPVENSTTFIDKGIHFDDLSEEDRKAIEDQYKEEGTSNFEEAPPSDINKFVFNKDTVKKVIEELMENGIKTDAGDKLGKTIIFAYNKKHAQFIVDTFDEMYPQLKGGFCARIVCDDSKVEQTIADFEKPDQNPFIAVSVDMLDTGVDVPEVVNLVFFKKVMSKIKFNQMIGRGTRLSPELSCCDGKNGIYEGKKYFYIFDWLRNFEFFRVNKDGVKGSETVSLTESIFNRRVEIIKELQAAEYQTPEYEKYRHELVCIVNRQIRELNLNLTSVHLHKKHVLKFQDINAFKNLEDSDVENLKKHVAQLVYMDEFDVYAKGFDNLVYGIEVLKCQKKNYSKQQEQIVNDANILLKKKANIEQVKAQIPLLTRIVDESYYPSSSILDLEDMRVQIRELIKFLVESKKKPIRYVDYIDTTLSVGEGTPVYTANNFEAYQKKVNSYITEHLDDEAIIKLRNNVRLTQDDYNKLNDVFTKELGTSEQFEKISDGKPLGVFVRSIAKMDRQKVNELFADFISEFNLNIKQIEFVKVIIENIIEQGEINLERLGDGKPPFDRPGKFFSLFNPKAQNRLIQIIRSVNENARVA